MSEANIIVTGGGVLFIAALSYYFFGPKQARRAEVTGNVQQVNITVRGGYTPDIIEVRKGVPLRLVFDRQENSECSSRVVFPDFHVSKSLAAFGTTELRFTPDRVGSFGFACGMNMLHGTLIVRDGGGEPVPAQSPADRPTFATAVGVGPRREVEKTEQAEFYVSSGGVDCPTCVLNIEKALRDQPGVDEVHGNYAAGRVTVAFDADQTSSDRLQKVISEAGYHSEHREQPG
ncbi:MAG: cupredoxin domain-containing protein, partial [Chloroflexi bacterium]|nr:cupredoxin domain-containing protein [Chloroflexota bacterium]